MDEKERWINIYNNKKANFIRNSWKWNLVNLETFEGSRNKPPQLPEGISVLQIQDECTKLDQLEQDLDPFPSSLECSICRDTFVSWHSEPINEQSRTCCDCHVEVLSRGIVRCKACSKKTQQCMKCNNVLGVYYYGFSHDVDRVSWTSKFHV